jgi:hypothetical protein
MSCFDGIVTQSPEELMPKSEYRINASVASEFKLFVTWWPLLFSVSLRDSISKLRSFLSVK